MEIDDMMDLEKRFRLIIAGWRIPILLVLSKAMTCHYRGKSKPAARNVIKAQQHPEVEAADFHTHSGHGSIIIK